jgi:hypothetical protein
MKKMLKKKRKRERKKRKSETPAYHHSQLYIGKSKSGERHKAIGLRNGFRIEI